MIQPQRYQDLGFGSKASEQKVRLINPDGSFNVDRRGLRFSQTASLYHTLITMSWWRFNAIVVGLYVAMNLVFASLYLLVGIEHLKGATNTGFISNFLDAFFFSTQSFTTVGYGSISPTGVPANIVASIESMTGLLSFALATGLLYGRFSRPTAQLIFSDNAVIAPYQNVTAFEFRIANRRLNQLIEVEAQVVLSWFEHDGNGTATRRFYELDLERKKVTFLHLAWTIVHPIDETSPLWGVTRERLDKSDAEFLIVIKGFDDTFSQSVHARRSYKHHEILMDTKFSRMIGISERGLAMVELHKISDVERAVQV